MKRKSTHLPEGCKEIRATARVTGNLGNYESVSVEVGATYDASTLEDARGGKEEAWAALQNELLERVFELGSQLVDPYDLPRHGNKAAGQIALSMKENQQ